MFFKKFLIFSFSLLFLIFSFNFQAISLAENDINNVNINVENNDSNANTSENLKPKIFLATVIDAEIIRDINKNPNSNKQMVMLSVEVETPNGIRNDNIEVLFTFPNKEFKKPLVIGDRLLVESTPNLEADKMFNFVSYYRQNNLVVWVFILIGIFLVLSGFKSNLKYIIVFLIFFVSGLLVLFLYHKNTFLLFASLFAWQLLASYLFAYRIFHKTLPSIILTTTIFVNQIISMLIVLIMDSINIFDIGVFDLFFETIRDARIVMVYVFAILVTYPVSIIFAQQILTECIKLKKEHPDITKSSLVKHSMKVALKTLNYIFLTIFGLFFSVFVAVVALASNENYYIQIINSSSLSRFLAVGFLVLFNLLIYIPLISAASGIFLGRLATHKLITDKNIENFEI